VKGWKPRGAQDFAFCVDIENICGALLLTRELESPCACTLLADDKVKIATNTVRASANAETFTIIDEFRISIIFLLSYQLLFDASPSPTRGRQQR
jgi:hypothetical protein